MIRFKGNLKHIQTGSGVDKAETRLKLVHAKPIPHVTYHWVTTIVRFLQDYTLPSTMPAENDEYPRPDFKRDQLRWQSLNGPWDFLFDDEDVGLSELWHQKGLPVQVSLSNKPHDTQVNAEPKDSLMETIAAHPDHLTKHNIHVKSTNTINRKRTIIVPYVFQCPASGIGERTAHEVLWYERHINDSRTSEERQRGDRVIIRFGAVDYAARVWVEGRYVGDHCGGHVPFDIDITDILATATSESKRLTVRVFDSTEDLTQPRGKQVCWQRSTVR